MPCSIKDGNLNRYFWISNHRYQSYSTIDSAMNSIQHIKSARSLLLFLALPFYITIALTLLALCRSHRAERRQRLLFKDLQDAVDKGKVRQSGFSHSFLL